MLLDTLNKAAELLRQDGLEVCARAVERVSVVAGLALIDGMTEGQAMKTLEEFGSGGCKSEDFRAELPVSIVSWIERQSSERETAFAEESTGSATVEAFSKDAVCRVPHDVIEEKQPPKKSFLRRLFSK